MRVSTAQIFTTGSNAISRQQAELLRTQQQIATGRRMLAPSDDPIASAEALRVEQGRALAIQHQAAQDVAREKLALLESRLGEVGNLYQSARELAIQSGNGALTNQDRASLASEIRGLRAALLASANTRDGAEGYLFSGYALQTEPFVDGPGGVAFQGDEGQRLLQVASRRELAVNESGAVVFDRIRNGNGTFVTAAGAANAGTLVVGGGSVANPAALTTDAYRVTFNVAAGATTYDVVNTSTGATVSTGSAYQPGGDIAFAGIHFKVDGSPANGDEINVNPSANVSAFAILDDLAAALATPVFDAASRARLTNAVNTAMTDLDQAMDTALAARTRAGAGLRELDQLANIASANVLQADTRLSALRDLDFAQAVSQLALQTTSLEAAQQAYLRTTGLTLFNYLS